MGNEFWPQDTDNEMYIPGECNILDIVERIVLKWPNARLSQISIEPDYIHTKCLGYDQFDSGDWTKFLIIKRKV
jgi:hypothetical protein